MSKKIAYFVLYLFIFFCGPYAVQAETESLELIPPVTQQTNYPLSSAGLQELLLDLHQFGKEDTYTIQLSGSLDLSQTTVGEDVIYPNPTRETINFVSIPTKLKVKGISAAELKLPNTCFFGQAVQFEDLTLQGNKIYGNGHQLLFKNIQHRQATQLFGGSNRDLIGDPKIIFQQVTGGSWEIYGGNESGTLIGNPSIQILDMTGNITQLCGGSLDGKVCGNVTTEIRKLEGILERYYGGGIGTTAPVEVTGEITNYLASSSENFLLCNFVGGVAFGRTGTINNNISGSGSFSSEGILIGGSQAGEIIGHDRAITTKIDTRRFQKGERSFVGGNQYSGKIVGDIENQIHAGSANKGSFIRIDGAGGMDLQKKSLSNSTDLVPEVNQIDPQKRTAEELRYDQLKAAERLSLAKDSSAFLVEGDVTTRLLGGCVSGGSGVSQTVRGAGFAGVIDGKVRLILGEVGLVYSKLWGNHAQQVGINPNVLPNVTNLASNYGFNAAAGGGDNRNTWENTLFINGSTELIVEQALLNFAYGGSTSGTIAGTRYAQLLGGKVNRFFGSGGGCYRLYGDSFLEITGGEVEGIVTAGSDLDRRMIGNAYTKILGGEFLGQLAGSYGARSNHMIDGNVETIVQGGHFKKNGNVTQIMGGVAKEGMISGNVSLELTESVALMSGLSIAAARPKNAERTNLLGGADQQIDFTLATKTSFSELEVLGDGGTDARSLITPLIKMDINAPNGDFSLIQGMVKNSYAGRLTHGLVLDIQAAQTIKALIGSDQISFTNSLIENSTAEIAIKFGTLAKSSFVETIHNFTQLTVENHLTAGTILNGSAANNADFGQTYHRFGELILAEGAQLAVSKLKTGELITAANAEIHSSAGAQTIFLRKLTPEKKLIWRLLTPAEPEAVSGNYFAQQKGYSVMTFAGNESSLSPENFIGFDETGHAYTGDSNGATGLAVAATIVEYQVISPLGKISHQLSPKSNNQPLDYWAVADDRQGEIIIPAENGRTLRLEFLETDQVSFQQAEITVSNGEKSSCTEPVWVAKENYYYQIQAMFQQTAESLKLLTLPDLIDFGQRSIGEQTKFYPDVIGQLEVQDTRTGSAPWQLTLHAETPEIGELYFQEAGQLSSLETAVPLFSRNGSFVTTFADWSETKGIFLDVPTKQQKMGTYSLTFYWTLTTKVE
ncbi:hypothetical protein [Enterococcus pingfangensis]|uniref:hypothetical protein n=1 Tax=Enterococcus pingfangensis TaxID=2559924 RepID=UPI0010F6DB96|nr:hypothetical protein [Enterococcus pingfangensis]